VSGRSAQDKRKRDKHAVDMAELPEEPPSWNPPPSDECDPEETYTIAPPGAEESEERVKLRFVTHSLSSMTVKFTYIVTPDLPMPESGNRNTSATSPL